MKKIVLLLTMLVGLIGSMSATTVFVEEIACEDGITLYSYYDSLYGRLCTSTAILSDEIKGDIYSYGQPTYVNIHCYEDVDTYMFTKEKHSFYIFWDEDNKNHFCLVFPIDEDNVMYMWFDISTKESE